MQIGNGNRYLNVGATLGLAAFLALVVYRGNVADLQSYLKRDRAFIVWILAVISIYSAGDYLGRWRDYALGFVLLAIVLQNYDAAESQIMQAIDAVKRALGVQ
mgnify:CR=1 FL=1